MKRKEKQEFGDKIINYRYKRNNNLSPDNDIFYIKLYFNNNTAIKLFSTDGMNMNINKLKKLINKKITKIKYNKDLVKITFKNDKKLKISTNNSFLFFKTLFVMNKIL